MVENLPAEQEIQVQYLGQEDALEKGMATHSSILGSGRCPGEGNGNPFQYSCVENSKDRGAWQATVHGVAKSQT